MKTKLLRKLRKNLKITLTPAIEDQVLRPYYTLQKRVRNYEYDDPFEKWRIKTGSFDFKYVLKDYLLELKKNLFIYKESKKPKEKSYQILP